MVTEKPSGDFRTYRISSSDKDNIDPTVSFENKFSGKVIKFGDPEYKKIVEGWDLILEGEDLKSASLIVQGTNDEPEMLFSSSGAGENEQVGAALTLISARKSSRCPRRGKVLSIAAVKDANETLSDNAVIEGTFTTDYVHNLVDLLNGGALPVNMKELSSEKIDATIGSSSMDKMTVAGVIAFGVIAVFLLAYYVFPGVIALIALGLYVLFTLTVLVDGGDLLAGRHRRVHLVRRYGGRCKHPGV